MFIVGGFVVFVIVARVYLKSEPGRFMRDRAVLRIPGRPRCGASAVIERFCRILGAMVQAGIPIADAMTAAIDSTDNRVFKKALSPRARRCSAATASRARSSDTGLFPGMVLQMMHVGEETGTLDQQLVHRRRLLRAGADATSSRS